MIGNNRDNQDISVATLAIPKETPSAFSDDSYLCMWVLDFPSTRFVRFCPLHQRIVDKGLKNSHEGLLVSSENRQSNFTDLQKNAFIPCDAQSIDHVLQSQVAKAFL
jgi:hypothetical protein